MATFECKVVELKIEPHPNADLLELAIIGDYRSIVRKGQFKTGSWGIYIPEGAVLPPELISAMGLTGKLAGKEKNRVKAIKLRGVLSQGLVYPCDRVGDEYRFVTLPCRPDDPSGHSEGDIYEIQLGQDMQKEMRVTKYEPPIPTHMAGEVWNAHGYTLKYDVENIKKYPDVIKDGDLVLITEKLHGTWTCFGYHPDIPHPIITSKGLSARGLAFKLNAENMMNLYIRSYQNMHTEGENGHLVSILDRLRAQFVPGLAVYVLGETFGRGVQDLDYGVQKPIFRAFDIYVMDPATREGRYLAGHEFTFTCAKAQIPVVPVLWHGSFSKEVLTELTDGKDNITGSHIREGVVVRPLVQERTHEELGRVILKSVSEAYLLRGEGTEYN